MYREERNYCVCCGAEIPEGSMVCKDCVEHSRNLHVKEKAEKQGICHPGFFLRERRRRA